MPSSIVGVDRALQFLRDSATNIEDIGKSILLDIADSIATEARDICPARTGRLRDSIKVSEDGKDIIVGAYAPYAAFVDGGTSKMQASPFLSSAVNVQARRIQGVFVRRAEKP